MIHKTYLPIMFITIFCLAPFAESIIINDFNLDSKLELQSLDIDSINESEKLDIIIPMINKNVSNTSSDGSILFLEHHLLKLVDDSYQLIEVPFLEKSTSINGYYGANISENGKWLIVTRKLQDGILIQPKILIFYDVQNKKVVLEQEIDTGGLIFNLDATIFPYLSNNGNTLKALVRENDKFISFLLDDNLSQPRIKFISSSGDRIFYTQLIERDTQWFYIDRENGEWSQPKELVMYDEEGNIMNSGIADVTADGQHLIVGDIGGVAIISEINDQWVKTDFINNNDLQFTDVQISDDGSVVAVQAFREEIGFSHYKYDIFVFFKTPSGEWIKQQVNSANEHTRTDILLSGDGTKLFWIPYQEDSSIPNSLNLDN